jgi:hypothetical protein
MENARLQPGIFYGGNYPRNDYQTLMVRRRFSGVSNHAATDGPASFETTASRSPQDEGLAIYRLDANAGS